MAISTQEVKNAVKEALAEENDSWIQPLVYPPPTEEHNIETAIATISVVDDLLVQKKDEGVRDTTLNRYAEWWNRFARAFPEWPNSSDQIKQYLRPFAPTNKLNHFNALRMLFNYGEERGLPNIMVKMKRPKVTGKPKGTIWPEQAPKIEAVLETDMEKKSWALGYGMG